MPLGPRGQKIWDRVTTGSFFVRIVLYYLGAVIIYVMLTYDLYFFDWGQLTYDGNQTAQLVNTTDESVNCIDWGNVHCPDMDFMQSEDKAGNTWQMSAVYSLIVMLVLVALIFTLIGFDTYMIFFRSPEPEFIEHISDTMPIELILNLAADMVKNFKCVKIMKLLCYIVCCILPVAFIPILRQILMKPFLIRVTSIDEFDPPHCICAYDWSSDWRQKQFFSCTIAAWLMLFTFISASLNYANGSVPSYSTYMCFSDKVRFLQIVEAQGPVAEKLAAAESDAKEHSDTTPLRPQSPTLTHRVVSINDSGDSQNSPTPQKQPLSEPINS